MGHDMKEKEIMYFVRDYTVAIIYFWFFSEVFFWNDDEERDEMDGKKEMDIVTELLLPKGKK